MTKLKPLPLPVAYARTTKKCMSAEYGGIHFFYNRDVGRLSSLERWVKVGDLRRIGDSTWEAWYVSTPKFPGARSEVGWRLVVPVGYEVTQEWWVAFMEDFFGSYGAY